VPPVASPVLAAPARATARVAPARPSLQAKLEVGPAGDHYERQADSVAASVMRGSGPVAIPPTITPIGGAQRKAAPPPRRPEEEKPAARSAVKAQRKTATAPKPAASPEELKKPAVGKASKVQRKAAPSAASPEELRKPAAGKPAKAQREAAAGAAGGTASPSVDASIQAMRSGPAAGLDGATRSFMENRFGRDFAGVRVHHDGKAAAAAQAIGARAFTTGNDIFFNSGEYQPNSSSGRQLIAHELTHTVQQGGGNGATAARTRIQRAPGGPAAPSTAPAVPEPDKPVVTVFTSSKLPGAAIDTVRRGAHKGLITLPLLGLPTVAGALKGTAGGENAPAAAPGRSVPVLGQPFELLPVSARDESSKGSEVWTAHAGSKLKAGISAEIGSQIAATPTAASIKENNNSVYYMTFRSNRKADLANIFIGSVKELAESDALLRPQWDPSGRSLMGKGVTLDADHFLELQIGGADSGENMWLLQGAYNSLVGNQLKVNIEKDLKTLKAEVDGAAEIAKSEKPASISEMKREWVIRFNTVGPGEGFPKEKPPYWTQAQIAKGEHIKLLKVMTEPELVASGIRLPKGQRPTEIKIFPSMGGGRMATLKLDAKGENVAAKTWLYTNMFIESGTYNHDDNLDRPAGTLMTVTALINKTKKGDKKTVIGEKRGPVQILRAPRLGIAGYISRESLRASLGHMDFKPMSPLTFSDMGISPEGELTGTGDILSSKALFPNLNVPLVLRGDRIMLNFPVPAEGMSLGPVSITEAALSLGVGDEGFFIEGYAGFALGNLGTGAVTAELTETGPRLTGNFNLAMDFLNPASVSVTYDLATDTLIGVATLGVQQGRIPGVDSGLVTVSVTREAVNVNGALNLGGPLRGTSVSVSYTEAEGLKIGAQNIQLPLANLPAVQNATLSIDAQKPPDGGDWIFSGTGTATLAAPGVAGTLGIEYRNGLLTVTGQGQVARGPATGTLNFTATNRQIDEEGHPIEGPPVDGVNAWGRGSVTVAFGNILTGTAGIEYTPDNRVVISGAIALPPTYPVFPRQDYNRDLFTLSPPEFPIWGVSVAGVGVGIFAFVDARVAFNAFVGPGEIRNAQIAATMDLDRPEDAAVTGHGEFHVPAYAGLTLNVGGGLRARATVAYAEGRVGLAGALGVEAGASAAIDISWSRAAGLALSADLRAEARPKFELSAEASVAVGVDLLVTEASHTFGPWRRVLGSFGPDMTLGVSMPVRWSEANGLDLSLDNIEVTRPSLDATALMTSVFDQLAA
jgi:hypothetical protein